MCMSVDGVEQESVSNDSDSSMPELVPAGASSEPKSGSAMVPQCAMVPEDVSKPPKSGWGETPDTQACLGECANTLIQDSQMPMQFSPVAPGDSSVFLNKTLTRQATATIELDTQVVDAHPGVPASQSKDSQTMDTPQQYAHGVPATQPSSLVTPVGNASDVESDVASLAESDMTSDMGDAKSNPDSDMADRDSVAEEDELDAMVESLRGIKNSGPNLMPTTAIEKQKPVRSEGYGTLASKKAMDTAWCRHLKDNPHIRSQPKDKKKALKEKFIKAQKLKFSKKSKTSE